MKMNLKNITLTVFAAAVLALAVPALLAQAAYADGEETEQPEMLSVEVGGVRVTNENKDGIKGENIRGEITYDPETLTLTLKDAYVSAPESTVAIRLTGKSVDGVNPEFTIVCEGKNRLAGDEDHWDFTGVGATATNVTIRGGSLKIASSAWGSNTRALDIKGNLTIDGVRLTALAYNKQDWFYCFYADGKIVVRDSAVEVAEINDDGDGGLTYGFASGSGTVIDHSVVNIRIGPDPNYSSGVYQCGFYRAVDIRNGSLVRVVSGATENDNRNKEIFYYSAVKIDETSAIELSASNRIMDSGRIAIPASCADEFLISPQMTGDDPMACETYTYTDPEDDEHQETCISLSGENYDQIRWLYRPVTLSGDSLKVKLASNTLTYNGKVQKPVIESIGGLMLKEGIDYTADWPDSVEIGDYTVNITLKAPLAGTTSASYSVERVRVKPPKGGKTFTYDGKIHYGADEGEGYTLTGDSATNAGSYAAIASLNSKKSQMWEDGTTADKKIPYTIKKAANTLKANGKTVKASAKKLKKKAVTIKRKAAIQYSGNIGAVTYRKLSVNKKKFAKKFLVNKKTGKITIKRGVKKGLYKFRIRVRAAGDRNHLARNRNVTVMIRVR